MNKLFVIRWYLPNGYEIGVSAFWNESALMEKMERNPEWEFELIADNEIQQEWRAR